MKTFKVGDLAVAKGNLYDITDIVTIDERRWVIFRRNKRKYVRKIKFNQFGEYADYSLSSKWSPAGYEKTIKAQFQPY